MTRLLSDPDHRARLAAAGYRAYSEKWTETAVIPQYLDIVRRAGERRRHQRVMDALATVEVA
jgi:hypothetical protein